MTTTAAVEVRGLTKRYGGLVACDDVSVSIAPGEVLALVGDNGAGKSTLIKMMSGATRPDEGEILVDGQSVQLHRPLDAREHGIETIYQDLALAPNLDVVSNMFMGRESRRRGVPGRLGFLDKRSMRGETRGYLDELDIKIKYLDRQVEMLSGGQRQSIAIARAARWATRLLIMDEPTAALGVAQRAAVLDLIGRIRDRGISVLVISHNMPDVLSVSDRILVMVRGRKTAELKAAESTAEMLVAEIMGRSA